MRTLIDRHRALSGENATLLRKLEERERRVRALEAQVLEQNQRRQDATKRVDDLIAQLDHLDAQLEARHG